MDVNDALQHFGIAKDTCTLTTLGNGLINDTYKVDVTNATYCFQRVNHSVFKDPLAIDHNIRQIATYLAERKPSYTFPVPLPAVDGRTIVHIPGGGYYRLFQFVPASHAVESAETASIAREAAVQFGRFTSALSEFPAAKLTDTIPDFHNLKLRWAQYRSAVQTCTDEERLLAASDAMKLVDQHQSITDTYEDIVSGKLDVRKRVCHHDTKISNVLFNSWGEGEAVTAIVLSSLLLLYSLSSAVLHTVNLGTVCIAAPLNVVRRVNSVGICVIDLDTVMEGFFISDLGKARAKCQ
jgi:Ser/Thr protein kinase RdoA (MazF antagonist)